MKHWSTSILRMLLKCLHTFWVNSYKSRSLLLIWAILHLMTLITSSRDNLKRSPQILGGFLEEPYASLRIRYSPTNTALLEQYPSYDFQMSPQLHFSRNLPLHLLLAEFARWRIICWRMKHWRMKHGRTKHWRIFHRSVLSSCWTKIFTFENVMAALRWKVWVWDFTLEIVGRKVNIILGRLETRVPGLANAHTLSGKGGCKYHAGHKQILALNLSLQPLPKVNVQKLKCVLLCVAKGVSNTKKQLSGS